MAIKPDKRFGGGCVRIQPSSGRLDTETYNLDKFWKVAKRKRSK